MNHLCYMKPLQCDTGSSDTMNPQRVGNENVVDDIDEATETTLSKAFVLKDTAGKGLFPHLFNIVENQHYIGPIPDARYYSSETMRPSERERFLEWHEDMVRKNIEFDFQWEIVSYCRNDVDILRRACLVFRKIFLDCGKVRPFEECTTIASTCMRVFRKNFLREKEIGIIPSGGYRRVNQSRKALKWLLWMERELGHTITHAGRSREHRIPKGLLVDGVNRDSPLSTTVKGDTIESRYEHTRVTSRLQKLGYIVTEKWDRTGNIVTRYDVTGTEKIRYVDVCSLYPFVLKTGSFSLGHRLDVYVGEECSALIGIAPDFDFSRVEGIVRCKVFTPRDLFHPVLPFRIRGKLLFALCRSCCETFSQSLCTHDNPADREFEDIWVSCELRKAIEKGYSVRSQEASGWPAECIDDEEAKERYLREYEKTEGIVLDRNNIAVNSGLRSVAKLCLNSFWGKFSQRSNLSNTEVVKTREHFMSLLTSFEHEIINILPVNDEVLYVSWRLRQEALVPSATTPTLQLQPIRRKLVRVRQVRLKLYAYLEKLDRRVLYYDTDSYIYLNTGDPNEYEPRTGNFLGDMTVKLESYGQGSYIESFVSGGPKFYAYVVRTPQAFHDTITRDESKSCVPVLLKRRFDDTGHSVPYGYVVA
ncbi:uncharacterized protein LOC112590728 [Harpegnathos saltator]|uniref:uncharacterized protein LOC112590728 n=1 Tax=Harpegnathos saltator TaxID=610380 RepID=UPI000DBEF0E4|nr:uncharacterized protein LOC112590728 [Harpegnathos saltator]